MSARRKNKFQNSSRTTNSPATSVFLFASQISMSTSSSPALTFSDLQAQ
jgi:hypothetical protein